MRFLILRQTKEIDELESLFIEENSTSLNKQKILNQYKDIKK